MSDGRLRIQANATKSHDGREGYMVTAWSDHVDPPQGVLAEFITKDEAAKLVEALTQPIPSTP